MRSLPGGLAVAFAATLLACVGSIADAPPAGPVALWQLPSQQCRAEDPTDCLQTNSYVLRTTNGSLIVIDGGSIHDAAYLRAFIAARSNPSHVHAWFVSHPHFDHVGALTKILEDDKLRPERAMRIDRIYGSILPMDSVAKYPYPEAVPDEVSTLQAFQAALAGVNAMVTEVDTGQVIQVDNVRFDILGRKNPEITQNMVNNSSIVVRISDGAKSMLFPGDLGLEGGQKLLNTRFAGMLQADYLQVSHHGQKGVGRDFYDRVHPRYALWPTPRFVWAMPTTQTTFVWLGQLGVARHYFQFDGLTAIDTSGSPRRPTS